MSVLVSFDGPGVESLGFASSFLAWFVLSLSSSLSLSPWSDSTGSEEALFSEWPLESFAL